MTMHPNAEKEIRSKIKSIIEEVNLAGGVRYSASCWEDVNKLARLASKQKEEYLSISDATSFIYAFVHNSLPTPTDAFDTDVKEDESSLQINDRVDNFIELLNEIPHPITFHFPLPHTNSPLLNNAHITSTESFQYLDIPQRFHEQPKEILFFVTTIKGYCGHDFDSHAPREAMSRLKIALQFLYSDGCIQPGPLRMGGFSFDDPAPPLEVQASFESAGEQCITHIELPQPMAELLYSMRYFPKPLRSRNSTPEPDYQETLKSCIERLSKLLSSESPYAKRIKSAAEWQIDAISNTHETMALIQHCIGLESIYGDYSSNGSLTESLSDRCAYSLSTSHEKRTDIKKKFKDIYKLRSKIVHGVINNLSEEDKSHLKTAKELLRLSIRKESQML